MAEALAEHGYARVTTTIVGEQAGVSSGTFYKHFGNLWDCLLAAYVSGADRLCEEIEAALWAARRLLVSRLAAMLRRGRGREDESPHHPQGLDERLIDATLAFLHTRLGGGEIATLPELVA